MTTEQLKIIMNYMNDCLYDLLVDGSLVFPYNLGLHMVNGRIYDKDNNPFYTADEVVSSNHIICPVCGQYKHIETTVVDSVDVGVLDGSLALSGQYDGVAMKADRRFIQSSSWKDGGEGICPFHGAKMVPFYKIRDVIGKESYVITNLTGFPPRAVVNRAIYDIMGVPSDVCVEDYIEDDGDEESVRDGFFNYFMGNIYCLTEFIEYYDMLDIAKKAAMAEAEESARGYMMEERWNE